LLHAFLVVFFCHSLHSVQEFMGYAMVQQLKNVQRKKKKTKYKRRGWSIQTKYKCWKAEG
jgi:hypothetical protein